MLTYAGACTVPEREFLSHAYPAVWRCRGSMRHLLPQGAEKKNAKKKLINIYTTMYSTWYHREVQQLLYACLHTYMRHVLLHEAYNRSHVRALHN
jgi:hypothetical protein